MIQHALALKEDDAVELMYDLTLVTPEVFDRFLYSMLAWYSEESHVRNSPPNLYELFEDHEPYTKIFFELFVESLAKRQTDRSYFDDKDKLHFSQLFRDNLNVLYDLMIYDYERVLKSLNVTYVWDSTEYGGEESILKNEVICEVW